MTSRASMPARNRQTARRRGARRSHQLSRTGPFREGSQPVRLVRERQAHLLQFAGDDWRDCMDYIRARCGLPGFEAGLRTRKTQQRWLERPNERLEEISRLQKLAANSAARSADLGRKRHPSGTPAETICATAGFGCRRKRHGARSASILPARGRTAPTCRRSSPASHRSKTICANGSAHRDPPHPPRRAGRQGPQTVARRTKGQAVKLSPDEDATYGLHLCEGIETGLALMMRGWRPLWACCTEGRFGCFRRSPASKRSPSAPTTTRPGCSPRRSAPSAGWRPAGKC